LKLLRALLDAHEPLSQGALADLTGLAGKLMIEDRGNLGLGALQSAADDLVAEGFDPAVVARVVGLVDRAEYKRRQMPPGVRISGKAFGKDRRMPITNHYRSVAQDAPRAGGTPSVV